MDYGDQDDGQGWDGSDVGCYCGDSIEEIDEDCPFYSIHVKEL